MAVRNAIMFRQRPRIPMMCLCLLLISLPTLIGGKDTLDASILETTATTQLNKKQTVALHHAVKKLLGFKDSQNTNNNNGDTHHGGRVNRKSNSLVGGPPQYMLDLYERYKHGAISHGQMTGNTVRCIHANIGSITEGKAFFFNLSSVARTENVFNAEIHIFKKRVKTTHPSISLRLHLISSEKVYDIGGVEMKAEDKGWISVDITLPTQTSISKRRSPADVLAVTFRKIKENSQKTRTISLHRFMKHHDSLPFLVLYSNDTQNITLDHVEPHFRAADLEDDIVDPQYGFDPTLPRDSRGQSDVFDDDYDIFKDFGIDVKGKGRERRSIHDNKIPEDPLEEFNETGPYNIPLTKPIDYSSKENKDISNTKPDIDRENHDIEDNKKYNIDKDKNTYYEKNNNDLIPYPEDYKRKRKNRRKNRRRNNRRKNKKDRNGRGRHHYDRTLPLPPDWEKELKKESPNLRNNREKMCGRRKLVVDFADIGWSDWIINPKSFEAHYCAGQCPFPLTKGMRPSNHATIQSLVHAIGIPADVPAPCCVPDVMTSVTLLYFDENRDVVLKNYPGMSVQSCACR